MNPLLRILITGLAFACSAAWAAERSINKEIVIAATLDQAWDAWTTRARHHELLRSRRGDRARVGGAFHIYFDPLAPAGTKGADDMRFMALQPKKMLSFDWNAPPFLPDIAGAADLRRRAARAGRRQARRG